MKGYLVLENGEVFEGEKIGYDKECICEVVFNTSMAGYLEVFTDPSYCGQGMCMTYPLIGNYGTISDDYESKKIWLEAIFIQELAPVESNFRSESNLNEFLIANNIPGLTKVNTRKLTKLLRENGTMKGMLTSDISDLQGIVEKIKNHKFHNFVDSVTSTDIYTVGNGDIQIGLMDFGAKQNIIRSLLKRNCTVTVFPSKSKQLCPEEFDGIVLSNGPGDPADCLEEIGIIKKLYQSDTPILGICLGHQLMGLATGAKTAKLKYGHRGPNQPVKDLKKDRVHITSQNHGYYILEESIDPLIAEVSHININDNTVEGLRYKNKEILTVQFHPEACPGPQDSEYIFDDFIKTVMDRKERSKRNA
jgi:carbamoyl-phosphate synthase small subunit